MITNNQIIEALLFTSESSLTLKTITQVLPDLEEQDVKTIITELNKEYEQTNRSFRINYVAEGWQLETTTDFAPWLKKMYNTTGKAKLSKPALETLAVIAYKQPATKPEIEDIRGVNVNAIVNNLLEKGFVRILGRKNVPGRPVSYGTTDKFLQYFGLPSIKDMPKLEELEESV